MLDCRHLGRGGGGLTTKGGVTASEWYLVQHQPIDWAENMGYYVLSEAIPSMLKCNYNVVLALFLWLVNQP